MLLVGAGLLVRSFVRLQNVSPGFDPEGVVSMRLAARARQFPNRDASVAYYRHFNEALAAVPGVDMRGAVSSLPFTSSVGWGSINVEGWTPQPGQELQVDQRGATPDYFRTMRIPLVKGRFFTDGDMPANAEPVAIIDEKFAQRFWPNGDADRQAPLVRSEAQDHDRRRRRHREAVRPRHRRPHRRLPADARMPAITSRGRRQIRRRSRRDSSRRSASSIRRSRSSTSRRWRTG